MFIIMTKIPKKSFIFLYELTNKKEENFMP